MISYLSFLAIPSLLKLMKPEKNKLFLKDMTKIQNSYK